MSGCSVIFISGDLMEKAKVADMIDFISKIFSIKELRDKVYYLANSDTVFDLITQT
ncbi:MAG: hypothetical protein ACJAXS_003283 [Colwellia sp.]|jgi:hypothetical protein